MEQKLFNGSYQSVIQYLSVVSIVQLLDLDRAVIVAFQAEMRRFLQFVLNFQNFC